MSESFVTGVRLRPHKVDDLPPDTPPRGLELVRQIAESGRLPKEGNCYHLDRTLGEICKVILELGDKAGVFEPPPKPRLTKEEALRKAVELLEGVLEERRTRCHPLEEPCPSRIDVMLPALKEALQ